MPQKVSLFLPEPHTFAHLVYRSDTINSICMQKFVIWLNSKRTARKTEQIVNLFVAQFLCFNNTKRKRNKKTIWALNFAETTICMSKKNEKTNETEKEVSANINIVMSTNCLFLISARRLFRFALFYLSCSIVWRVCVCLSLCKR